MQLCSDERGFISVLKRRGIIDQENKFIFKPDEQTVFIQSSYFELIFEAMTHQFQMKFHSEQKKIRTMSSIPPPNCGEATVPSVVGKQQLFMVLNHSMHAMVLATTVSVGVEATL